MTDARHAEFARMYRAGESLAEIAKALRICTKTASAWRDRFGLPRRPHVVPAGPGVDLDAAALDFIRRHYNTPEWSAAAIAHHLGVTKNVVVGRANRMFKHPPSHHPFSMPVAPPPSRCQWISGEVTPAGNFDYCGEPVLAGQSYCRAHARKALTRAAFEKYAGKVPP